MGTCTNTPSSFVKASKMVSFRSSVSAVWLIIVLLAASKDVEAQSLNATFAPWTVMGPVNTNGSGYVATNFTGESLSYSVSLFNVVGLHSVEIHVGDVNTHGEVAAVLYAAAFPDASSLTNGVACAGTLEPTGLLGPFLLPLGNHLEVSDLYDRYIMMGDATVVIHTMANPGGELGAPFASTMSSSPTMAPMAGMAGSMMASSG